jgi:hypothetical protein
MPPEVPVVEPEEPVEEPPDKLDSIEEPSEELSAEPVKLEPIEDIAYPFCYAASPGYRNSEVELSGSTSLRLEAIEAA